MFLIRVVVLASVLVAFVASPALAVTYQPPVAAPVTDSFRPPSTPYGPGNRGWEYQVKPGAVVRSAADGEVVFAGQVGGVLNVVVRHADGMRTTYSKLSSIAVTKGKSIRLGDTVGHSAGRVYFGARCDGEYIDPKRLFAPGRVYLVALDGTGPGAVSADDRLGATTSTDVMPTCPSTVTSSGASASELAWMRDSSKSNAPAHAPELVSFHPASAAAHTDSSNSTFLLLLIATVGLAGWRYRGLRNRNRRSNPGLVSKVAR